MSQDTKETKVYFAGIPVAPDVKKLIDKFGLPDENTEIKYETISELIGAEYLENRWRSVTNAWRGYLSEHNIVLVPIRGMAFVVADPDRRLELGCKKLATGIKTVGRAESIIGNTERARLSEDNKGAYDKTLLVTAKIRLAGETAPKPSKRVLLSKND